MCRGDPLCADTGVEMCVTRQAKIDQRDLAQGSAFIHDHVRRLHIAVRQPAFMQMMQRLGQAQADVDAILGGPLGARLMVVRPQCAGLILDRIDVPAGPDVIADLHHIIIKRHAVRAASHVQDVHQARVIAGNRLEFQDALELPLEAAFIVKVLAPHHLHRPERPGHPAGVCRARSR